MQTSQRGMDLIKEFEGRELEAYPDPGTGGDPWTIGYGHTGSDVYPGLTITQEKAEQLLSEDLKYFEKGILGCISVPLNQNQFDALVSFAYNLGVGALAESTLARLLNEGNYQAAADQFERWVNAGDEPMPGLVSRRHVEKELFLST
ncbi:lysozyme [Pseudanabaena sp. PCC 6802]|uniref:lysozyme n=1 Tax=Pseudanabaena sp. PCC 6802 TaxID=118173 RepID=UPI00047601A3